jgi:hypothetical protein
MRARTCHKQMGVGERQDIGHPARPSEDVASRASHMRGLMTSMARDNLVVGETMIYCGCMLASDLMRTCHSGMDMAKITGKHCGIVGHLKLRTDRVSALSLNGNSVEHPFQKAGDLWRCKDRWRNTMTQALWETRVVIDVFPGLRDRDPHWRWCKAGDGWPGSHVEQGRCWTALN